MEAPKKRFVISISGNGGCGKDEAAKFISLLTGMRYVESTSRVCVNAVRAAMSVLGAMHYTSDEECHADRRNHRDVWAKLIDVYNYQDAARLYKMCLLEQDILTGIRKRREFSACRESKLIDLAIWIDRPGYDNDSTQEYGPELCDVVIQNDQCLKAFQWKLTNFCHALNSLRSRDSYVPSDAT